MPKNPLENVRIIQKAVEAKTTPPLRPLKPIKPTIPSLALPSSPKDFPDESGEFTLTDRYSWVYREGQAILHHLKIWRLQMAYQIEFSFISCDEEDIIEFLGTIEPYRVPIHAREDPGMSKVFCNFPTLEEAINLRRPKEVTVKSIARLDGEDREVIYLDFKALPNSLLSPEEQMLIANL